jgi:hypothetical protein
MFFVGAVFSVFNILLFHKCILGIDLNSSVYVVLKDWSLVVTAAIIVIMFEIGFILNRASSILIAPVLERTKIWPKEKYDFDVLKLSRKDPKFQSIITELVLIRTHILLYLVLTVESLFSSYKLLSLACLALIILLLFSGRKHNARINTLRQSFAKQEAEESARKKGSSSNNSVSTQEMDATISEE